MDYNFKLKVEHSNNGIGEGGAVTKETVGYALNLLISGVVDGIYNHLDEGEVITNLTLQDNQLIISTSYDPNVNDKELEETVEFMKKVYKENN